MKLNKVILFVIFFFPIIVFGQRTAKYGADFLAGGVDAKALGMGSAVISLTDATSSTYWNPSGLSNVQIPDVMFMHAERFAGIVSYDFGSFALPVGRSSAIGLGFIRSGVNDIKDTRDAWDFERDVPKPNPENYFRTFSQADYAVFLSYAKRISAQLSFGASGKVIFRKIGDFADAFGYSTDIGLQYRKNKLRVGVNLQDISTMLQSWSINESEFEAYRDEYGVPVGGTELVLPVARVGVGYVSDNPEKKLNVKFGADIDVAFDGQQAFAINAGDISFHPRIGTELFFQQSIAFRAGISGVSKDATDNITIRPTVGVGLKLRQIYIDYAFGDFSGITSDLGNSHIISLRLTMERQTP